MICFFVSAFNGKSFFLFFAFSLDVPENTYDLKEFYMKVLKEEFDDLRQSKSQFLLVLDGLDEVLCTHLFSRDSYLSKKYWNTVIYLLN